MFGGLLVLPIVGIAAVGGWGELTSQLRAIDPYLLDPMGQLGWSPAGIASAVGFIGIGLAFLGAPQLLTRFISARSRGEIVNGSVIAVICIVVFDIGAVFAGMAGRVLFGGLADPETILPTMSTELFPAVFTGIFLVIVLAAILSTVDSLLILASSAVVRDVVQKVYNPDLTERQLSMLGRLTTAVIGIGALALALPEVRAVFWFVLFAWSGIASAFAPVVLCSLFWKRTDFRPAGEKVIIAANSPWRKVLVTGGSGFNGVNLIRFLLPLALFSFVVLFEVQEHGGYEFELIPEII